MDKILAPIKKRARNYLEYKGITLQSFYKESGLSASNFKGEGGKSELGGDKIAKILSLYDDLNAEWLLTGNGDMVKVPGEVRLALRSNTGIPLIPISAVAGVMSGNSAQVMEYDCDYYDVPLFKGADFLINVTGDSMVPKYYSGDIVACKRLSIDTFLQWNKAYVVDSEQGVIIKRVQRGSDDDHILMVSENMAYEPFPLHRKDIYSIALVMGLVRAE